MHTCLRVSQNTIILCELHYFDKCFFINGMFYFGPFYLNGCQATPSWQECRRRQYIRPRCNSSLGGISISIFRTDFCYGLSFISTFLSESEKRYQLMPWMLPWYTPFSLVRPHCLYHQPPMNICAQCPVYTSLSRSIVLNAMPS